MTESNWRAVCKTCDEWLGVAHLEERGGSFHVMDGSKCTCPPDLRILEIRPHEWYLEQELRKGRP